MGKEYKGFVISLEKNIYEEKAMLIKNLIYQIKGVIDCHPVESQMEDHINQVTIRQEIYKEILGLVKKGW